MGTSSWFWHRQWFPLTCNRQIVIGHLDKVNTNVNDLWSASTPQDHLLTQYIVGRFRGIVGQFWTSSLRRLVIVKSSWFIWTTLTPTPTISKNQNQGSSRQKHTIIHKLWGIDVQGLRNSEIPRSKDFLPTPYFVGRFRGIVGSEASSVRFRGIGGSSEYQGSKAETLSTGSEVEIHHHTVFASDQYRLT